MFFSWNHNIFPFCPSDQRVEDACVPEAGGGFFGIALVHKVNSIREYNEIVENLRKSGVKITKEPQHTFWSGYDAYFQDADDYLWKISWTL